MNKFFWCNSCIILSIFSCNNFQNLPRKDVASNLALICYVEKNVLVVSCQNLGKSEIFYLAPSKNIGVSQTFKVGNNILFSEGYAADYINYNQSDFDILRSGSAEQVNDQSIKHIVSLPLSFNYRAKKSEFPNAVFTVNLALLVGDSMDNMRPHTLKCEIR